MLAAFALHPAVDLEVEAVLNVAVTTHEFGLDFHPSAGTSIESAVVIYA